MCLYFCVVLTVGFEVPSVRVDEDSGTFRVCIVKDKITTTDISVDIGIVQGTATQGMGETKYTIVHIASQLLLFRQQHVLNRSTVLDCCYILLC